MNSFKRVGNYKLKEELGRGNFSTVYLAEREDDQQNPPKKFAIKCLNKEMINNNSLLKNLLASEATIMREIKHKNIIHCYEFYETQNNFYLVLDYCDKGDLESYLNKLKVKYLREREAIKVIKQILKGFVELRKYEIIHRDLKLSNIFLHQDRIIIGDFGMAKVGKKISGSQVGTPINMAPEVMQGDCSDVSKSDLWSIGVILYTLLFGQVPFFGLSLQEIHEQTKYYSGQNLRIPNKPMISETTKNLLQDLLQYDYKKRIEWRELFNHQYFEIKTTIKFISAQAKSIKENNVAQQTRIPNETICLQVENENSSSNYKQSVMIEEVLSKMSEKQRLLENYYKYVHELNKINFFMKNSRELINFILRDQRESNKQLCKTALTLVNFSFHQTSKIINQLDQRVNFLDLKDFEKFSTDSLYQQLIDLFKQKQQQIQRLLDCYFVDNYLKTILTGNEVDSILKVNKVNEIERMISSSLSELLEIIKSSQFDQEEQRKDFLLMSVKIFLSNKISNLFQYWQGFEKFNWQELDFNYNNMSSRDLLEIINLSLIDNQFSLQINK